MFARSGWQSFVLNIATRGEMDSAAFLRRWTAGPCSTASWPPTKDENFLFCFTASLALYAARASKGLTTRHGEEHKQLFRLKLGVYEGRGRMYVCMYIRLSNPLDLDLITTATTTTTACSLLKDSH